VGETTEKALEELITRERQSGVYLTCLGVGMGNFKDSKLETLAKRGNGNYAYLDDIREAEKVLVKEVTQTFFAVADDVLLNVHFNPKSVRSYRLIGFDNKRDAISDSLGTLEGGEIGSGNSIMAMFEVVPQLPQNAALANTFQEPVAEVTLKYSLEKNKVQKEMKYVCTDNYLEFNTLGKHYQFATAVSMFGLKLRQSRYLKAADWYDIETVALASYDPEDYLQKEFVQLITIAKKLYPSKKKKKKSVR
jgi:Ca-activated chloride channel family protein